MRTKLHGTEGTNKVSDEDIFWTLTLFLPYELTEAANPATFGPLPNSSSLKDTILQQIWKVHPLSKYQI